jgi:hypothetical protein
LLFIKKFRVKFLCPSSSAPSKLSIQILIIFKFNGKIKFVVVVDDVYYKKNFTKKKV